MRRLPSLFAARLLAAPLIACLLLAAVPRAAEANTYSFRQDGFAGGGTLAFTVTGADLNGDGFLERQDRNPIDEVTAFALSFSGGSVIAPFSFGMADLLVFDLDLARLNFLGPRDIIFAGDFTAAYIGGAAAGADCTGIFLCGVVAALDTDFASGPLVRVPAPAALPVLGVGLLGLAVALRRPRSA